MADGPRKYKIPGTFEAIPAAAFAKVGGFSMLVMKPITLAVLCAIRANRRSESDVVEIGMRALAKCAQISDERYARRELRVLEKLGLIKILTPHRRGPGSRSVIQVLFPDEANPDHPSGIKLENPDGKSPIPDNQSQKPDAVSGKSPTESRHDSECSQNSTETPHHQSERVDGGVVRRCLLEAGVRGKALDDLSRKPGITPELVSKISLTLARCHNPAAVLVKRLREAGPDELAFEASRDLW